VGKGFSDEGKERGFKKGDSERRRRDVVDQVLKGLSGEKKKT